MKNRDKWVPSKFIYKKGKLIASRNKDEVGISSRLVADIVAQFYDKNFKIHAKGKLLDLGCGKVPFYQAYKDFITDNVCVDWDNSLHDNIFLDYKCDLSKKLPFKDSSFDTIVLSDVLEHIPYPEHLWGEMARLLSKGGKVIMNVAFFYGLHEIPHDYYRYTKYALSHLIEKSKLKIVKLESIGGLPEVITDLYARYFMYIPIVGTFFSKIIQRVMPSFLKLFLIKKRYRKTCEFFPLGYSLIVEKPR